MKTIILSIFLSITLLSQASNETDSSKFVDESVCVFINTDSYNQDYIEIEPMNETPSLILYFEYSYTNEYNITYYVGKHAYVMIKGNEIIYKDEEGKTSFFIESLNDSTKTS